MGIAKKRLNVFVYILACLLLWGCQDESHSALQIHVRKKSGSYIPKFRSHWNSTNSKNTESETFQQRVQPKRVLATDINAAIAGEGVNNPFAKITHFKHKLNQAKIQSLHLIGTTSKVYRVEFTSGMKAAFKVPSKGRPQAHKHEIAAFLIGTLLGMDQIPMAIPFELNEDGHSTLLSGALMEWIFELESLDLEKQESVWLAWLMNENPIPEEKKALAKDLSEMLVFDYLIGNGDRFSGSNMKGNRARGRLTIRDHDLAFPKKEKRGFHRTLFQRKISKIDRFSKNQIQKLTQLDEQNFALFCLKMLGTRKILSESKLEKMLERKKVILSYVTAKTEELGSEKVLVF